MPPTPEQLADVNQKMRTIQRLFQVLLLRFNMWARRKSRGELLYKQALLDLGRDASPVDVAPDELGCAESVSNIIRKVVRFPIITGTWTMNQRFLTDRRFGAGSRSSGRGTIIICATGTGNGKMRGHVGILGNHETIMSASSATGLWVQNYNVASWLDRYEKEGGFDVKFYILK